MRSKRTRRKIRKTRKTRKKGGDRSLTVKDVAKWNRNKRHNKASMNECTSYVSAVNSLKNDSFIGNKLRKTISLGNVLQEKNCKLLLSKFSEKANRAMAMSAGKRKRRKSRRRKSKRRKSKRRKSRKR